MCGSQAQEPYALAHGKLWISSVADEQSTGTRANFSSLFLRAFQDKNFQFLKCDVQATCGSSMDSISMSDMLQATAWLLKKKKAVFCEKRIHSLSDRAFIFITFYQDDS